MTHRDVDKHAAFHSVKTVTFVSSRRAFPGGHNESLLQLDTQPADQYTWLLVASSSLHV